MKLLTFLTVLLLTTPRSAISQDETFVDLSDEIVAAVISEVRPRVGELMFWALLPRGDETLEELEDPLLSPAQVEEAVVRGIITGFAQWCELDWRGRSFSPFMKNKRNEGRTPKQMAYTGALHGYGVGLAERNIADRSCYESGFREHVSNFLY